MKFNFILYFLPVLILVGCEEAYTPKPRAYYRIDLPLKNFQKYSSDCPFTFEYPEYATAKIDSRPSSENCWMNIDFPQFNARIHISYKPIEKNLEKLIEDSRSLTYKHVIKATDIREDLVDDPLAKVYGQIYDVKGDAASYLQFYLTDSSTHFLRGSLYFNAAPNYDSIVPVLDFIRADIHHLTETFNWK
jgi:gliding motility-associated lipoprotein GldD